MQSTAQKQITLTEILSDLTGILNAVGHLESLNVDPIVGHQLLALKLMQIQPPHLNGSV